MPTCLRVSLVIATILGTAYSFLPLPAQDKSVSPQIIATLSGHTDIVYSVAVSPDGKYVATGSFDNTIKLWEAAGSGRESETFTVSFANPSENGLERRLQQRRQPTRLRQRRRFQARSRSRDVLASRPLRGLVTKAPITSLALSPDNSRIALGTKDGPITVHNLADFKELFKLTGHQGPVRSVAFSGNGQTPRIGGDRQDRFASGDPRQRPAARLHRSSPRSRQRGRCQSEQQHGL